MKKLSAAHLVKFAKESKTLNLDLSLGEMFNSSAFGSIAELDDPWDLICYRFYMYIRHVDVFDEVSIINLKLADSLRKTLELSETLNKRLESK
jgi:hypothetical protein